MKKRKLFEVSLINKAYSRVIQNTTRFYTSDTALEIGFNIVELEYSFDSAEVILLNETDRSLVTRELTRNGTGFTYELESDIIEHYGNWAAQLKLEKDEEVYISSPVGFSIENDLYNSRPPKLSEVNTWKNLRSTADGLIDDIRSELALFEEKKLEIETAETTRQQAETQRATAESSRVSAEEQRKIDHANRSAELDGKADKLIYEYSPTLLSGYVGGSTGKEKIRIYKDSFGFVHISGRVEGSRLFGYSNPIFNVPKELRPLYVQAGAVCVNSNVVSSAGTGVRIASNSGDCHFTVEPPAWVIINFSYFAGL